jgi:hypothetical protein
MPTYRLERETDKIEDDCTVLHKYSGIHDVSERKSERSGKTKRIAIENGYGPALEELEKYHASKR